MFFGNVCVLVCLSDMKIRPLLWLCVYLSRVFVLAFQILRYPNVLWRDFARKLLFEHELTGLFRELLIVLINSDLNIVCCANYFLKKKAYAEGIGLKVVKIVKREREGKLPPFLTTKTLKPLQPLRYSRRRPSDPWKRESTTWYTDDPWCSP